MLLLITVPDSACFCVYELSFDAPGDFSRYFYHLSCFDLCLTCEFSVKRTKINKLFWLFTDYHKRYLKSSLLEVRNLVHSILLLLEKTFSLLP